MISRVPVVGLLVKCWESCNIKAFDEKKKVLIIEMANIR